MDTANIASNIKALREGMGLTQQDLSNYLGIARELISYYETGSREVPVDMLHRLADLLGVELADLLEENAAQQAATAAFAFRTEAMDAQALESIAAFRRVVKNYLKMNALMQSE